METFTYSIARTTKDSFGISRPGAVYDLSESDLAEIQSAGHLSYFESVMDLEDGTECADGFDGEGNTIRVYRTKGGIDGTK